MKKTGFSLAEILITLAIVGFIAAITLPSLQLNVEKQKVGPAVMKVVNTLEVANSVALQVAEVSALNEIALALGEAETNYLGSVLKDYTKLVRTEYNPATTSPIGGVAFATKDGITLIQDGTLHKDGKADVRTSGNYYKVYMDINGGKAPNKIGKDIFTLLIDTRGLVIPYGSELGTDYVTGWKNWKDNCKTVLPNQKVVPDDPETCSGSIVDNGGRVLYFYDGIR